MTISTNSIIHNVYLLYCSYFIVRKFGKFTVRVIGKKVWQISRSAERLSILRINLDGLSVANHR